MRVIYWSPSRPKFRSGRQSLANAQAASRHLAQAQASDIAAARELRR